MKTAAIFVLVFVIGVIGFTWFIGQMHTTACSSKKMSYDIAATAMMKCNTDPKCAITVRDRERLATLEYDVVRLCGKVDKREIP